MVEGVGFEIRKVGHAGAGVQIVSSPPKKRDDFNVITLLCFNVHPKHNILCFGCTEDAIYA